MKNIEIPYVKDRGKRYRFFEILPGALTWSILILPFVLSIFNPRITVFFIIAYTLLWFAKAVGVDIRALQGYGIMNKHQKLPWAQMLTELENGQVTQPDRHIPAWHYENVRRLQETTNPVEASDVIHAVIIATWNEGREVLEPTIKSVLASDFDMKRVILIIAYEDRGGPEVESRAKQLIEDYKDTFMYAAAFKHIDQPGEIIGKGGNITASGRHLQQYLEMHNIDPLRVIVTTLDADNRPHPKYLPALTYVYALAPDPLHLSFQPVTMYTNNIWDAPAPMRVVATGNSFWNMVLTMRPHLLRNFSAHAQSMQAVIDTDFWSVRTVVEDGHQFWRTYFRYDGNHEVVPVYLPIYQDAVLARTYLKTLKAQFVQFRRWAWGASDVAYVAEKGFFTKNKVPKLDVTFKFLRLLEGHVTWAVAPLILAGAAFVPLIFNPKDYAANQLPIIVSRIQTIALIGISVTLFVSLKTLPPRPKRYKAHRNIFMLAQWIMLPVTSILYNSLSALNAQTRLMFGKYLGKFDLTEKAVVTEDKRTVV